MARAAPPPQPIVAGFVARNPRRRTKRCCERSRPVAFVGAVVDRPDPRAPAQDALAGLDAARNALAGLATALEGGRSGPFSTQPAPDVRDPFFSFCGCNAPSSSGIRPESGKTILVGAGSGGG